MQPSKTIGCPGDGARARQNGWLAAPSPGTPRRPRAPDQHASGARGSSSPHPRGTHALAAARSRSPTRSAPAGDGRTRAFLEGEPSKVDSSSRQQCRQGRSQLASNGGTGAACAPPSQSKRERCSLSPHSSRRVWRKPPRRIRRGTQGETKQAGPGRHNAGEPERQAGGHSLTHAHTGTVYYSARPGRPRWARTPAARSLPQSPSLYSIRRVAASHAGSKNARTPKRERVRGPGQPAVHARWGHRRVWKGKGKPGTPEATGDDKPLQIQAIRHTGRHTHRRGVKATRGVGRSVRVQMGGEERGGGVERGATARRGAEDQGAALERWPVAASAPRTRPPSIAMAPQRSGAEGPR